MKQTEGTRCAVSPDGNDPYYPGGQCGLVIGVRGAEAAAGRSAQPGERDVQSCASLYTGADHEKDSSL